MNTISKVHLPYVLVIGKKKKRKKERNPKEGKFKHLIVISHPQQNILRCDGQTLCRSDGST